MYFNIIILSTPCSSKWALSLTSPHQNSACTSPVPIYYHPHPQPPTISISLTAFEVMQKKKWLCWNFYAIHIFLDLFSSECAPNYACVKTGNLYLTNRVNSCCEGKFSGERSWDDEVTLNRWNLNIHFAKNLSTFVLKRQNGNKSVTNVWNLWRNMSPVALVFDVQLESLDERPTEQVFLKCRQIFTNLSVTS